MRCQNECVILDDIGDTSLQDITRIAMLLSPVVEPEQRVQSVMSAASVGRSPELE